jgi:sulfatase modifying factor 1
MNTTARCLVFLLFAFVSSAHADVFNMPSGQTSLQTVVVGNSGNANDPNTGNLQGGVAYNYNIGKYDVTVGQYTAFLNAVAATDTYGLYNPNMATDLNIAGIAQNGTPGSYSYSVIGSPNKPITYVNWGSAARFVNWLNNGQPTGGETLSTTEDGAYFLNGAAPGIALNAISRKPGATWFIPTESEWYKAAYYNPATNSYFQYPTSSNLTPTPSPPGSTPNTANFLSDSRVWAVTGSSSYSSSQNYLTDVGSYSSSASPYGAFDMGGDVYQWNEALYGAEPDLYNAGRGIRGGTWTFMSQNLRALSYGYGGGGGSLTNWIGFRVASAPDPITEVLGDFNQDGHTTTADISSMMKAFANFDFYMHANGLSNADMLAIADVNGDGAINNADLQALLDLLKTGGGSTDPVPEPSTLVLAFFACVGLMSSRRFP